MGKVMYRLFNLLEACIIDFTLWDGRRREEGECSDFTFPPGGAVVMLYDS